MSQHEKPKEKWRATKHKRMTTTFPRAETITLNQPRMTTASRDRPAHTTHLISMQK